MDPLYQKIVDGLNGPLDPQVFERCMGDLLRDLFPGLVPVPGGNDAGMDGAIADGEREPFPLVCTTAKDVLRNLTRSLEEFKKRGSKTWKVALATSRPLTSAHRRKLEGRAREKGFTLIQIIEQRGIADRLYRDSRWRKELLNLSGKPSALSVVPVTKRPLLQLKPVGRDKDLRWLRSVREDSVLIGEPGSGKTFLFYHLMQKGWNALFLDPAAKDEDVADALRDQRPQIVVVDDAHAYPERLKALVHLRREIEALFSIVAVTWTWEEGLNAVVEALGSIPESRVHKLELLTRDEILDVIEQVGVEASDAVLRDLVDQASNKPGLAVTIATLWLQGSWEEVLQGKALSRNLLTFFNDLVGRESADLLAAFGLGGDRGMGQEAVREYLNLSRPQIRQMTAALAAGGVLRVSVSGDEAILSVWPRQLRFALIRSVFFPGNAPGLGSHKDLLKHAPSLRSASETLVATKAYGADIPSQELRDLVFRANSQNAWGDLAALDEQEACWVLENYPGDVTDVATGALEGAPEVTTSRLLREAATVLGSVAFQRDHAMRILSGWVKERRSADEMIWRRRLVAKASARYLDSGGAQPIGVQGICLALSPNCESNSLDPGEGRVVTISWGLLPKEQLFEIEEIWEDSRDSIREINSVAWGHLATALWNWVYPVYAAKGNKVPEYVVQLMHAFAARVLSDLAPLGQESPGLVAGLRDLAGRMGIELPLQEDPLFAMLFPPSPEDPDLLQQWEDKQQSVIKELAAQWLEQPPTEIVERITYYEREAERIGRSWPRNTPGLCREIATNAKEPDKWLNTLVEQGLRSDLVQPFLERVATSLHSSWQKYLKRCLDLKTYAWPAAELVFRLPDPPPHLLDRAFKWAVLYPKIVEIPCLRRQVPLPTLKLLLSHPNWELALAAAVGEWTSTPERTVRAEVLADWRATILRAKPGQSTATGSEYWLADILGHDLDLAFDWLRVRLQDPTTPSSISDRGAFATAVSSLDKAQRMKLFSEIPPSPMLQRLIPRLVKRDAHVYREVLKNKALKPFYLSPLSGVPDEAWVELAVVALEAGCEARVVASASLAPSSGAVWTFWSQIKFWSDWDQAFASLEHHPRGDIREVARWGRKMAAERIERAKDEERQQALEGS